MEVKPALNQIALAIAAHPLKPDAAVEHRVTAAGRTLAETLAAEGVSGDGWAVSVGGVDVPAAQWARVRVKPGHLIECRAVVRKQVLQLAAVVALSYFTLGAGGLAGGSFLGLTGLAGTVAATAAFVGGSIVINKLLGQPKVAGGGGAQREEVYGLSGGRNTARPYEPLGLLLGESKVVPDLASQQFTWFAGDDQYLSCVLHAGINCASVTDIRLGETFLGDYSDVAVTRDGFISGNNGPMPLSSVDTVAGGLLDKPNGDTPAWTVRTSSPNAIRLQVDFECQLSKINNDGKWESITVEVDAEFRTVGGIWQPFSGGRIAFSSDSGKPLRRTVTVDVPAGQYEIRMRKVQENATSTQEKNEVTWTSLKSFQPDLADYAGQPRVRIEVKASGQLSGALDSVSWIARALPMPLWNGSEWVTVTEPGPAGISNPGAQILMLMRGIRRPSDGRLIAGLGLPDSKIDLESLKAFMVRCAVKGFRFDEFIQRAMNIEELLEAIADAGFARLSRGTGRYGVVWLAEDQPISGVVNMATMKARSFAVDYDLIPTAEEAAFDYYDADRGYTQQSVRVVSPLASGTPNRQAPMSALGIHFGEQGARRARFMLGQSIYARKSISWEMDAEYLIYRRGSLVALSHDLTQWGAGGRVAAFRKTASTWTLDLDAELPETGNGPRMIGIVLPHEQQMRVYAVSSIAADRRSITVNQSWPAGLPEPGADGDVMNTTWLFDIKPTPGYRVRIVSIQPVKNMTGARVTAVPEPPEFWDYVWNGAWTPPSGDSLLSRTPPVVSNPRITAERVRVGEAWRTELTVLFDVVGNYDHAQVWGAPDGGVSVMLGAEVYGTRATWAADRGQQWQIEVRPFDGLGRMGTPASTSYTIAAGASPAVGGLNVAATDAGIVVSWVRPTGIAGVDWSLTELRTGTSWETGTPVFSGRADSFNLGWLPAGTLRVWAANKNTAGEWGAPVSATLAIAAPAAPVVDAARDQSAVRLGWQDCRTSQPIRAYRISRGEVLATATALGTVTATTYTRVETLAGTHRYWVQAEDVAGNRGAAASIDVEVLGTVEDAIAGVVDEILGGETIQELLGAMREIPAIQIDLLAQAAQIEQRADEIREVQENARDELLAEARARMEQYQQQAADLQAQAVLITANANAIQAEIQNRINADAALAGAIDANASAIIAEATARAQALADVAATLQAHASQIAANAVAIADEVSTRISEIQAEAGARLQLAQDLQAAISAETSARLAAVQGLMDDLQAQADQIAAASAAIAQEAQNRAAEVSALVDQLADEVDARIQAVAGVAAGVQAANTAIQTEVQNRTNALVQEAADRDAAIELTRDALDARIDALTAEVAGILGIAEYSSTATYAEGDLVTYGGKLYRALAATTGNAPTDPTYWEVVGNYTSLGEVVSDLSGRMTSVELVTAANVTRLNAVEVSAANSATAIATLETASADHASRLQTVEAASADQASRIQVLDDAVAGHASRLVVVEASAAASASAVSELLEATDTHALRLIQLEAAAGENEGLLTETRQVQADQVVAMDRLRVQAGEQASEILDIRQVAADQATRIGTIETAAGELAGRVQTVENTTAAHASRLTTVEASAAASASKVATLETASADQAARLETVEVQATDLDVRVSGLTQASADQATAITTLEATAADHGSRISVVETATASQATRISTLEATAVGHASRLQTVEQATADQASRLSVVETQAGQALGRIGTLETTVAGHASRLITVEASAAGLTSRVATLEEATDTHALRLIQLEAAAGENEGAFTELREVQAGQALAVDTLRVASDQMASQIVDVRQVQADQATRIGTVETSAAALTSRVQTVESTTADQGTRLAAVETSAAGLTSRVGTLETTTTAHASRLSTVETTTGTHTSQIQVLQQTTADQATALSGLQTMVDGQGSRLSTLETTTAVQGTRLSTLETTAGQLAGRVNTLETTTAGHASRLSTVEASAADSAARVTSLEQADADMAQRLDTVEAAAGDASSAITTLQQAQASQATRIGTLETTSGQLAGRISAVETTTAGHATRLQAVEASAVDSAAKVVTLQDVTDRLALQVIQLEAAAGENEGLLTEVRQVAADTVLAVDRLRVTDGQLASEIVDVRQVQADQATRIGTVETNAAALTTRVQTVENTTTSHASRLSTVEASAATSASKIGVLETASASQASRLATLETTSGNQASAIQALQQTTADQASSLNSLTTTVDGYGSRLTTVESTTAAQGTRIGTLETTSADTRSRLQTVETTTANHATRLGTLETTSGQLAGRVSTLETTAAGHASRLATVEASAADSASKVTSLQEATDRLALQAIQLEAAAGESEGLISEIRQAAADQVVAIDRLRVQAAGQASEILDIRQVAADQATRIGTVETSAGALNARVQTVENTTASQGSRLTAVEASASGLTTRVGTLETASASQAGRLTTVEASAATSASKVGVLETASAAQAQRLTTLETTSGTQSSQIQALQQTDATQASQISSLSTTVDGYGTRLTTVENTTASQASRLTTVEASAAASATKITGLEQADEDAAFARFLMQATDGENEGLWSETREAVATQVTQITRLRVDTDNAASEIQRLDRVQADQATSITSLTTRTGAVEAGLTTEQTVRQNADTALSTQIQNVSAVANNAATKAELQSETTARVNAISAMGTRVDGVQATANGASAAVQDVQEAIAETDGKLAARRSMRVQVSQGGKNYVAGMQLGIEENPAGGVQSEILFLADRIGFLNLVDDQVQVPFALEGGIAYLDNAMIKGLTADRIDTRNLTIKDAAGNVIFGAGTKLGTPFIQVGAATSLAEASVYSGNNEFGATSELWKSSNVLTFTSTGAPVTFFGVMTMRATSLSGVSGINLCSFEVTFQVDGVATAGDFWQTWRHIEHANDGFASVVMPTVWRKSNLAAGSHTVNVTANLSFGGNIRSGYLETSFYLLAMENKL